MAGVSLNLLKITKFNGSNYREWSFNMSLYLESLDLFQHAECTAEIPGSCATEIVSGSLILVRRKRGLTSV